MKKVHYDTSIPTKYSPHLATENQGGCKCKPLAYIKGIPSHKWELSPNQRAETQTLLQSPLSSLFPLTPVKFYQFIPAENVTLLWSDMGVHQLGIWFRGALKPQYSGPGRGSDHSRICGCSYVECWFKKFTMVMDSSHVILAALTLPTMAPPNKNPKSDSPGTQHGLVCPEGRNNKDTAQKTTSFLENGLSLKPVDKKEGQ